MGFRYAEEREEPPSGASWRRDPVTDTSAGVRGGRSGPETTALLRWQRSAGNRAVSALIGHRAPTTPLALQRHLQLQRASGIAVHPSSRLDAKALLALIKRSRRVPGFLKRGLTVRGGALQVAGTLTRPEGTISEFLEPFMTAIASGDWQITTADSTITVTGTDPTALAFSQLVTPHLAKGQRLGSSFSSGPGGQRTFGASPLYSKDREVIFGWTVPATSTEQLKTGRGLIVVVRRITVIAPSGRKKVFVPSADEVVESVIHEISAHAGRISSGLTDTHGTRSVDDISAEVAEFFRFSEEKGEITPFRTATRIFQFVGAK
ncbi:hypothetical protein [Agromyces sp. Marseille-P2726]|uniref:hypothetical protein n=1 Tax=Agromyces sp. Marseille-P2726 TaxID=2709132 RepID=UPI00156F8B0C|nr:hypothetical protein [Agromyces sp. Marseille-P2726]